MFTVMETQCSVHVVTKVIVAWQYIERYLEGEIELTLLFRFNYFCFAYLFRFYFLDDSLY